MELAKPKAILFDWDNTLVDTWPIIHQAMVHCFTKMEQEPWTLEETKTRVAHSMREAFPKLFGDRWEEAGRYYQEGYLASHLDNLTPYDGALETVKLIQHTGIYQAIVSNKKGPTLRIEANHLEWGHYFGALVGGGDATNDKPHVDHAMLALQNAPQEYPASSVWFIGDSSVDIEIAKNAGFTAIFYGSSEKAQTISYPIHAQVSSHDELQKLLSF